MTPTGSHAWRRFRLNTAWIWLQFVLFYVLIRLVDFGDAWPGNEAKPTLVFLLLVVTVGLQIIRTILLLVGLVRKAG